MLGSILNQQGSGCRLLAAFVCAWRLNKGRRGALAWFSRVTLAMAAMGLEVSVRRLAKVGGPAILTGLAATVVVCAVSLALIKALL